MNKPDTVFSRAGRVISEAGLGTGLAVLAVALAICVTVPALIGLSAMNASDAARDSQRNFRQLQFEAEALSTGLLEIQAAVRGYASTGDAEYARSAARSFRELRSELKPLSGVVDQAGGSGIGDEARDAVSQYMDLQGPSLMDMPDRLPVDVRRSIASGENQRRIDHVRGRLMLAEEQFKVSAEEQYQRAESYTDRSRIASIAAMVAGLLTIGLASIYMLRSVRRPIVDLDDATMSLGYGVEEARVEPTGPKEVQSLGAAFNEMAAQLVEKRKNLEAASQAKSDFLARMSHELRTPLNAILGFGQLLEMDDLEPSERESVAQIMRAGRHLLALIDEVLDISKIESGALRISMEPVPLANVLGDVRSMVTPLAAERDVNLVVEHVEEGLHAMADQQRLKQVLLNLLSNGIKYNRLGGEVRVGAFSTEGRVKIVVSDEGSGIDPEYQDRLFAPFERLGAENKGFVEGTGLGLALSRRLVSLMGGELTLESTGELGSTFAVSLGRADTHQGLSVAQPLLGRLEFSGRELVIVCIEDNPSNFELVRRILDDNFDARIFSSIQGSLGLDLVNRHRPDAVLLDLHLPDMTGEKVLSRIKSDHDTAEIPVIVMSADATNGDKRRMVEAGAMAYLTKPLDVHEFLRQMDLVTEVKGEPVVGQLSEDPGR